VPLRLRPELSLLPADVPNETNTVQKELNLWAKQLYNPKNEGCIVKKIRHSNTKLQHRYLYDILFYMLWYKLLIL
jgi:hypothetical protein